MNLTMTAERKATAARVSTPPEHQGQAAKKVLEKARIGGEKEQRVGDLIRRGVASDSPI